MSPDQVALLEKFRFNLPDDLATQAAAIAQATGLRDSYLAVDAAYAAAQTLTMDEQDGILQAKKGAADALDADATHVYAAFYRPTHPRNGGTAPAEWEVRYYQTVIGWATATPLVVTSTVGAVFLGLTTYVQGVNYTLASDTPAPGQTTLTAISLPGSVSVSLSPGEPVTIYSHAVNWDSNALLLACESGWTAYQNGRFHSVWGVNRRAARMTNALATMATRGAIISGREDGALALIAMGQPVRKRKLWTTADFLATRQPTVAVKSQDGLTTYSATTDYRVVEGIDGLEDMRTFQRREGSTLAAVVAVEAP